MLKDWSFSVNLDKPRQDDPSRQSESLDFSTDELLAQVQQRLDDLKIDGLEQYRVLLADGRYVRDDRRLMPSPFDLPPRRISGEIFSGHEEYREACRRSYWCACIVDWNGEMVLTTYLRFKKGRQHLFVEASNFILPPLKQAYYAIDTIDPELRVSYLFNKFCGCLIAAPFKLLYSPYSVFRMCGEPLARWLLHRRTVKAIRRNPLFNYGAITSIRQLGREDRFRVYFQRLDRDMHLKTVEQTLIDTIVDFLEEHNIDTSDIKERRSTILNNGVMISGGSIMTQAMAVGTGANAVMSKIKSMAQSKPITQ